MIFTCYSGSLTAIREVLQICDIGGFTTTVVTTNWFCSGRIRIKTVEIRTKTEEIWIRRM